MCLHICKLSHPLSLHNSDHRLAFDYALRTRPEMALAALLDACNEERNASRSAQSALLISKTLLWQAVHCGLRPAAMDSVAVSSGSVIGLRTFESRIQSPGKLKRAHPHDQDIH